jgi:hypothetical protein
VNVKIRIAAAEVVPETCLAGMHHRRAGRHAIRC